MPPSDGWYLLGPFIAVALVGFLGAIFWRMGLQWTQARDEDPLRELYAGLAIFGEAEDYGLLCRMAEEGQGPVVSTGGVGPEGCFDIP